ncbi:hypothetical protein EYZ51_06725 [Salmonella enterica subsp. enterica]|nr:hypothetical protein [Salmonella enterica subsp. enterica serovar Anecho]ECD5067107.1 hypothetical protein [Salmonella enterica subsp. enterica serovar Anecho]TBN87426.1 hypothetical protein EYZ55_06505 [Salmonella enterica subsp. enterica]TBN95719.1 hypothetical protein EYZ51_06725 [Salmonella enterica subsp. enterica]
MSNNLLRICVRWRVAQCSRQTSRSSRLWPVKRINNHAPACRRGSVLPDGAALIGSTCYQPDRALASPSGMISGCGLFFCQPGFGVRHDGFQFG